MYTIIEDRSPYFIRFTHDGLDTLVDYCKNIAKSINFTAPFTNHRLSDADMSNILALTPLSTQFDIGLIALFHTMPGVYYRAHKDGRNIHTGFNYSISILDTNCTTQWYSDDELKDYKIDFLKGRSREVSGFIKANHTPVCSMSARMGECVLFNTEIYHDFDNSMSESTRMLLIMRLRTPADIYFDDAKKIMFGLQ